jgi:hypothetical protein
MSFPLLIAAAGRHYPRVGGWVEILNDREGKCGAGWPRAECKNAANPAHSPEAVVFTYDVNKLAGLLI